MTKLLNSAQQMGLDLIEGLDGHSECTVVRVTRTVAGSTVVVERQTFGYLVSCYEAGGKQARYHRSWRLFCRSALKCAEKVHGEAVLENFYYYHNRWPARLGMWFKGGF